MTSDAQVSPDPRIGTPQHMRWLRGIVMAIIVLNGIDVVLTILWVSAGLANEANELLSGLLERQPVLFVCAKLSLAFGGSWVLWKQRNHALAVVGLFLVFLVYYWLLLYHLEYAGILLRSLAR